jgi:MarR-like DNA-binding transcriptional regulator SgrR of sgrS sRNA
MRTTLRLLAISSLGLTSIVLMLAGAVNARTRPHYGGLVRMESSAAVDAMGLVTETLTSVDASGRVEPFLAERWEAQNGGRRWQFLLRTNVRFHDGSVVSAADVAQGLSSTPGAPWRTVQANGSTVVFEADQPLPSLPALLSLPQYAISKSDSSGLLIGTGPFRMNGSAGKTTKLVAFDDYWRGRPYVDAIELNGGRGVREQWMDMGMGRADIVEVPAEQIRHAQQERLRMLVSRDIELIALIPSANSLQDVRMRQAISAAIDRTSLLNVIFQRQGEVAAGVLPNWMTGYDFLFTSAQNLPLARDLRVQAGQTGTITIAYEAGDGIQQLLAERVVLNARDAGIVMQAVPHNGSGQADLNMVRLTLASPNASVALRQITSASGVDSVVVDPDPDALFRNERDLLSSFRVIPLLYVPRGYAASQPIRNWALDATGAPGVTQVWTEDRR